MTRRTDIESVYQQLDDLLAGLDPTDRSQVLAHPMLRQEPDQQAPRPGTSSPGTSSPRTSSPGTSEGTPTQTFSDRDSLVQHSEVVDQLIKLLNAQPALGIALQEAIKVAAIPEISTLEEYYDSVDQLVTAIPTANSQQRLLLFNLEFYLITDSAPNDALRKSVDFQNWTRSVADAWGSFLDSPESAAGLPELGCDPNYHLKEFHPGPSGWMSFNQFFARELRAGLRHIASPDDDSIIVSPGDCAYQVALPITPEDTICSKGATYTVPQLLDGSPHAADFEDGFFTHALLTTYNYHRFHSPVPGKILEARTITGKVSLDVYRDEAGKIATRDGVGFQFTQERGLIIIDSPLGKVAVLPIGMGLISSVTFTASVGVTVAKGEEIGFFEFGGSDIVVLFPKGTQLEPMEPRRMGQAIGQLHPSPS